MIQPSSYISRNLSKSQPFATGKPRSRISVVARLQQLYRTEQGYLSIIEDDGIPLLGLA